MEVTFRILKGDSPGNQPVSTKSKIVGFSSRSLDEEIIVTYDNEGIETYSVHTQKLTGSLALPQTDLQLASRTVWDPQSRQYFAALSSADGTQNSVSSWTEDQPYSLLKGGSGVALPASMAVHSLYSSWGPLDSSYAHATTQGAPNSLGSAILLSLEGDLSVVLSPSSHSPHGSLTTTPLPTSSKMRRVEAAMTTPSITLHHRGSGQSDSHSWYILLAVAEGRDSGSVQGNAIHKVYAYRVTLKSREEGSGGGTGQEWLPPSVEALPASLLLESPSPEGTESKGKAFRVASIALTENGTLAVLWSEGSWQRYQHVDWEHEGKQQAGKQALPALKLPHTAQQHTGAGGKAVGRKRQKDGEEQDSGQSASMVCIPGTSCVAVVAAGSKSDSSALFVSVLDTSYGCLMAHQQLDKALSAQGGSHGRVTLQWVGESDGQLMLSTSHALLALSLDGVPEVSLANVLGALGPSRSTTGGATGWAGLASTANAAAQAVLGREELGRVRRGPHRNVGWSSAASLLLAESAEVTGEADMERVAGVQAETSTPGKVESGEKVGKRRNRGRKGKTMSAPGKAVGADGKAGEVLLGAGSLQYSQLVRVSGDLWSKREWEREEAVECELLTKLAAMDNTTGEEDMADVLLEYAEWRKKSNGSASGEEREDGGRRRGENGGSVSAKLANGVAASKQGDMGGREWKKVKAAVRLLSPEASATLAQKCLLARAWRLLRVLLEGGQLSPLDCPELVGRIVEAGQVSLLEAVVKNLPDLPPADVALALRFVLSLPAVGNSELGLLYQRRRREAEAAVKELEKEVLEERKNETSRMEVDSNELESKREEESKGENKFGSIENPSLAVIRAVVSVAAVEGFTPLELCLHSFVASGKDENVLSSAILELNADHVVVLVRYLGKWLEKYLDKVVGFELQGTSVRGVCVPSLAHLCFWASVVIDCHLARLTLMPDCLDDLKKMKECVSKLTLGVTVAAPLMGMLTHLKKGCGFPGAMSRRGLAGDNSYSIEILDIN